MNNLENYFISIDDYIFSSPTLTVIKHQLNCEQAFIYKLDQEGELENIIRASDEENVSLKREDFEQINHNTNFKKILSIIQKPDNKDDETVPCAKAELIVPIYLKTPEIIELNNQVSLWGILVIYDYNYLREWKSTDHEFVDKTVQQMTLAIERNIIYQKLKQLRKKVQSEQIFDEQTGLINYSYFLDCLDYEWCNLNRYKKLLSVILLEINYPITRELANIIQQNVNRPGDVVASYNQLQIIIMLPGTDNSGALWVNRQVVENIENSHQGNLNYKCRSSIVTCFPTSKQDYEWLLHNLEKPFSQDIIWQGNVHNKLII